MFLLPVILSSCSFYLIIPTFARPLRGFQEEMFTKPFPACLSPAEAEDPSAETPGLHLDTARWQQLELFFLFSDGNSIQPGRRKFCQTAQRSVKIKDGTMEEQNLWRNSCLFGFESLGLWSRRAGSRRTVSMVSIWPFKACVTNAGLHALHF